jgi:hypothetical protein
MGTLTKTGQAEAVSAATPDQVWAVLADVTRIGEWSHECHGATWLDGATTATAGARYRGVNRSGRARWRRRNEILTAEPGRELSWRTVPSRLYRDSTRWRIRIEPHPDGTRIVQTFEVIKLDPVLDRLLYATMKAHRDRLPALNEDMRRLGQVAMNEPTPPAAPTVASADA